MLADLLWTRAQNIISDLKKGGCFNEDKRDADTKMSEVKNSEEKLNLSNQ